MRESATRPTDRPRARTHLGGKDAGDDLHYQAVSCVRRKITDELTTDVELLREHHPDLYAELREAVCDRPD